MSDTEVIEKAKGTMAKIVLAFIVAPITLVTLPNILDPNGTIVSPE